MSSDENEGKCNKKRGSGIRKIVRNQPLKRGLSKMF